ncbi:S-adenosyl-L-methionine dependent methyltransferase [Lentinula aff. lateritia]|uniref:S-adenosyl-L-methionine dependent methyltransferase n=1 Tax=Lentinula aff. lateritia TaxID=2804960 RepID=A0ACC1TNZ4_9AGAR|nr:S-adenosyl-L-methionine dependent methyltransferase [Lentinula aff. lateritia]
MHPRNIYRDGIDFGELSAVYPPLRKYVGKASNSHNTIDFKDQGAQRCLTEALLHRDFKLKIRLSPDRLCPPVPNRLNYILWLQDITFASRYIDKPNTHSMVLGLDIGTGASAIYPLLACSLEKSWQFVVSGTPKLVYSHLRVSLLINPTEIDPSSFATARQNISTNKLDDRIQIIQSHAAVPILLPLHLDKERRFDFTMCNPPFYSSLQEVIQSAEAKQYGPNAVCTGAEIEMITSGGESAFVGKMVTESLDIRERCNRWYTSMLGKLSSVAEVVDILKSHSIDNYIIMEFVQGQTRRWAVGWSFSDTRLPDTISRIQNSNATISKYLPAHNTILQPVVSVSRESLYERLSNILSSVAHIVIRPEPNFGYFVSVQEDTWSRIARRRKKRRVDDLDSNVGFDLSNTVAASGERPDFIVEFTWRKGRVRALFDSFCSHVSRKIVTSPSP